MTPPREALTTRQRAIIIAISCFAAGLLCFFFFRSVSDVSDEGVRSRADEIKEETRRLESGDAPAMAEAADRLGAIASDGVDVSTAVPALIEALDDDAPLVYKFDPAERFGAPGGTPATHAASALGEIGDHRAVPALTRVLNHSDDSYLRQCAAEALGEICNVGAKAALAKALDDESEEVQKEAEKALEKIDSGKSKWQEHVERREEGVERIQKRGRTTLVVGSVLCGLLCLAGTLAIVVAVRSR